MPVGGLYKADGLLISNRPPPGFRHESPKLITRTDHLTLPAPRFTSVRSAALPAMAGRRGGRTVAGAGLLIALR